MKHMEGAKKRKGWRQALALLVTLVLVCGLAAPAYAEDAAKAIEVTAGKHTSVALGLPQDAVFTVTPEGSGLSFTVGEDGTVKISAPENAAAGTYQVSASDKTFSVTVIAAAQDSEIMVIADAQDAERTESKETTVEPAKAAGETTEATEETKDPTGETTDPTEETTAPTEEATDPTEGTTAPTQEPTQPIIKAPSMGASAMDLGDISLYALNDIEINVGESKSVSGNSSGYSHSWTSSDDAVATVSGNGSTATVTGVGGGTATITHYYGFRSETCTVTVTGSEADRQAQVFFLATPTSNADSNDIDQWGTGIASATVNMTGAKWTDTDTETNKNVFNRNDPLAKYINSWPDGSTGDTWTITPDKYPDAFQEVYNAYKTSLEKQYGIKGLQLSDLTEITLTPHKISQNNGGDYPTHIDCTIDIKCNIAYTVKYHVQEPGETGYTNVYNESKAIVNGNPDTINEYSYAQTKDVDGITYEFDGWYNEANEASKANKVETWPYAPNETELADGTVNFYARYIPQPTTMTIKKVFSGLVGNDVTTPEITVTVTGNDNSSKEVSLNTENNYSYTLEDLDPTVIYTVAEDTDNAKIEGYNWTGVTYSPANGTIQPSQSGTNEVTITNTYTPSTTTVTVSKTVTGGLGDRDKDFSFTVTVKQDENDASFKLGEDTYTGSATFNLHDRQSAQLTVPVGSTVTVTETDYGESNGGYTTSYKINSGEKQDGREATLEAGTDGDTITFTNHKEASPDTGVLLDSLPYVLILAAVAAGVVLMLFRKRRNRDAD